MFVVGCLVNVEVSMVESEGCISERGDSGLLYLSFMTDKEVKVVEYCLL